MSPTFNGSLAVRCFEGSNTIKIHNGIVWLSRASCFSLRMCLPSRREWSNCSRRGECSCLNTPSSFPRSEETALTETLTPSRRNSWWVTMVTGVMWPVPQLVVCSCDYHVTSLIYSSIACICSCDIPSISSIHSWVKSLWHRIWTASDATSSSMTCSVAPSSSSEPQRRLFEITGSASRLTSSRRQRLK